ncbi:hypothetical protein SAMN05660971_00387 [Halomonas cupida]|uniref:Uncharacterized protein n=1 Tax=Halomonas cupida TaxID=44933 RepID=A0A1M7A753_9GAMM|nr:hypothetical protein SAMN05660971_00387 [Halomonas cupida]
MRGLETGTLVPFSVTNPMIRIQPPGFRWTPADEVLAFASRFVTPSRRARGGVA